MKTKYKHKGVISKSVIAVFLLTASYGLMAQEQQSANLKDFKITIERTEYGVNMISLEGNAWTELTFNLNNNQPQAIDEYGMTELDKVSAHKDSNLADILFTIAKTKDGVILKGLEGTAWEELSFALSINEKQSIDQLGMAKLN